MRRIALTLVIASTLAWAGATAIGVAGCSSDPEVKPKADGGRSASSSGSSSGDDDDNTTTDDDDDNTSSGGTSSGNSSSGDAGSDSGTLVSNAKKISCGANECTKADEGQGWCCWTEGDQTKAACGETGGIGACVDNFNGFNIGCDEKADCDGANICCWGDGQTLCTDSCDNAGKPGDAPNQPDIQMCKTDAECGAGVKCTKKECLFGADGAPDADKKKAQISVCGAPANCK